MDFKKVAVIGCGSMGGGLALLLAENGLQVSLNDPSETSLNKVLERAERNGLREQLQAFTDYEGLCKSLASPKVFLFSLPHGTVGDSVLAGLMPFLEKGDMILDAANEHYENTERRQGKCYVKGIRYIGVGVSGGYQAAREGPSLCPGADDETLDLVMPLLEKISAKDKNGRPAVAKAGLGGAGHYVKMVHNGIEHGMMSAIAEAWKIMNVGLGMTYDEIGDVLEQWNTDGELRSTFLIDIGADICRKEDDSGKKVLSEVEDKVVQDVTEEEGTGVWSNMEAIQKHIAAPTLNAAHAFRLASAYRGERIEAQKATGLESNPKQMNISTEDRKGFLEALREAVYVTSLVSFVQGISVISQADKIHRWNINFPNVLQIWRAGCIIRADHIADTLEPVFARTHSEGVHPNLLLEPTVAQDLKRCLPSLKKVVMASISDDHIIPAISSALEYIKYETCTDLPTQFYEAQLDYFGCHMYDRKGEPNNEAPTEGRYHFEWKPVKGS